ncbi:MULTISPECIES: enolase C-terminal domain-like protein [Streptomycetaceae]|uniref:Mandalate racemase n=1 Tax=Streptantibioticus cattleyicolor (strain ATCC 35852 / DSM 46488 / JCM 4925 / NBRC 14057 / NRRL 8057) TaxID=1003195 RepID=F8JYN1_STREN|nr:MULTISPECIES: enolase C-terminal domain-like protein [Streptomycetaceae]AEW97256.1 mandalate racemase [Streptantibioticus cattleyicolor NRRL 8057 = DSM 46488]MYS61710.1 mandelate racemase [Streptomyces sp. SID5468]CCB77578.1 Mandelate racemase/muconate lactonizing enzyme [Streptantibioticus cattleyicolor NRRL 8057 = DSM 46488]
MRGTDGGGGAGRVRRVDGRLWPEPDGGPVVERLEASAYAVPTDSPAGDTTSVVLVRAYSGEVSGLGWTYAPGTTSAVVHELLAGEVIGRGALEVPAAHEAMCRAVRDAGRPGLVACALSAVDLALWDLKARLLGLPLATLLGSAVAEVPVYGSGGFTTYPDVRLATQLEGWVRGHGIGRVKIQIGQDRGGDPARDLARARHAREMIGSGAELFVDAGGAYARKQAVRVGRVLADYGVSWFEEPVPADDLAGLRVVRDALDCDVAAGEYGYDLPYFARLTQAGAVDCLQVDVTRCGGVTEWLRAAALARAHCLDVSGHRAPHAHAHVAAAVPNARHLEWFHDHVRVESLFFDGVLDPTGGTVTPGASGEPGLGLTLKEADVARYRVV